jgi:hypothetical protein
MAKERTRPPLSNEVVSTETLKHEDEDYAIEVHSFDAVPFSPSEALAAAVANGSVITSKKTVEFWINDPRSSDYDAEKDSKVFRQVLTETTATNKAGALILFGGDESKVWEAVSSFANRNAFQNVYVDMKNAASGPEKAVKRVQKLFAGLSPAQLEAAKAALAEAGLL